MHSLSSIIHIIFTVYTLMLLARVLESWLPNIRGLTFMRFVRFYTEPYLKIFRKIIPSVGMLDLSPLAAFFALRFAEKLVLRFVG